MRRISVSRSVSRGASPPPAAGRGRQPPELAEDQRGEPGVNTASPSAVRRTASRNSGRAADFSR